MLPYFMGRLRDATIGLAVGMLEDLFYGDEHCPQAEDLEQKRNIWRESWSSLPSRGCCGASVI